MATNYVKFRRGNFEDFQTLILNNAIEQDTLYFIYEEDDLSAELFLGSRKIAGSNLGETGALEDLKNVIVSEIKTNDILIYQDGNWVNKTIDDIFGDYVQKTPTITQITNFKNNDHQELIKEEVYGKTSTINDIIIIKDIIADDCYEHTGYIFNGENWIALNGNYSAESIYFNNDFIFTENIGTVQIPENQGNVTVKAKGKNLKEFLSTLFAEEKNPVVTPPSAIIVLSSTNLNLEVGEIYSPEYTIIFNGGNYSYGPDYTGVEPSYSVVDSYGNESSQVKDQFDSFNITDDTNYTITATVNYSDGVIPFTNLGNQVLDYQITSGTLESITTQAIKGYRKTFYGTVNHKDDFEIRDLPKSSTTGLENGSTFTINIPVGALKTVIAYPATLRDMISVLDKNDSNSNIVSSFLEPEIIAVKGANDYEAIDYKVYTLNYANPYNTSNIYTVTI